jgi:VanZ family protein
MVVLFVQSSIGSLSIPDFDIDWFDKILHFIVFGILGALTARGFRNSKIQGIRRNYIAFSILICILYGLQDEIHQSFVPGRYASTLDWLADIFGILFFVMSYKWYRNSRGSKEGE